MAKRSKYSGYVLNNPLTQYLLKQRTILPEKSTTQKKSKRKKNLRST